MLTHESLCCDLYDSPFSIYTPDYLIHKNMTEHNNTCTSNTLFELLQMIINDLSYIHIIFIWINDYYFIVNNMVTIGY